MNKIYFDPKSAKFKISILLVFTFLSVSTHAQIEKSTLLIPVSKIDSIAVEEDENDSIEEDSVKIHAFSFSISLSDNQMSGGRKLETNILTINPKFHYCYREGLYVDLYCIYFPALAILKPIDSFGAGIGYSLNFWDNFNTGLEYSFTSYSTFKEVTSSAPHALKWSLNWDNPIVSPALEVTFLAGTTKDVATTFELSHSFEFKHIFATTDQLSLPLSISTTLGTSNFYQAYLINNEVLTKKKKKPVVVETIDPSFALNDINLSLSVSYEIDHFSISPEINYQIPFNHIAELNSTGLPLASISIAYSF